MQPKLVITKEELHIAGLKQIVAGSGQLVGKKDEVLAEKDFVGKKNEHVARKNKVVVEKDEAVATKYQVTMNIQTNVVQTSQYVIDFYYATSAFEHV